MRPDLAKCTTESYRAGRGYSKSWKLKFGGRIRIHPDPDHDYETEHGGFKSSARHRHDDFQKQFTDRLGALRGNIHKSVGRKWDDVFSEFCQHLDRRSLSGYHIWTHLIQEVTLNTFMRNGEVWECTKYSGECPVMGYFVHPVTGILEYSDWKKKYRVPPVKASIPVPGNEEWKYEVIDNLWFSTYAVERIVHGVGIYTVLLKKSASKKEIAWIRQQLIKRQCGSVG